MCEEKNCDNSRELNKDWGTKHCDFITTTSETEKSNYSVTSLESNVLHIMNRFW